ncbi:MAG: 50S ribosomal protein L23 [Candidatus Nomurabacteria bacterium GW2011_GWF2_35_12]|uniref:50S ribosomal protein L23 n=3 Tax=Candidatus Nomuraibacteriota TaxID=1752729 RepID=A0A0G0H1M1_9BACT|nr:MAG: 50S ribosomal protein L23 [Candidatus Nomurabacteria bacterium GW2011_GWF2_35_12]KKP72625.1 MAG: 50S ribosomal protein L23 [Candidatus Nomurabacteria bacterium GW2011_GWB1_35_20]KKP76653.1 MAG: 50S ribosomal protein L23 [Parcubacteria group bacterium GW2011_GWC1_35_21]KKP84132.1 MAG: 50S ribosomal protein L23 [Parcubacteria group bacterium GW2011_GWD2_35_7]KKP88588.1 MAG: 50S ribosomal protein L23 [Candidatus Nomurabacteria bacterium GW2011_GWA2_35_80]KKP97827.1 MAG: 50S ribosomal prot
MSDIILKTIKNPRVTEKVSNASAQNVYTFNIAVSANKKEVEKAVFSLYKVKPVKINILSIPHKNITSKGKKGTRGGGKKAVVFLKKEDKIEFI